MVRNSAARAANIWALTHGIGTRVRRGDVQALPKQLSQVCDVQQVQLADLVHQLMHPRIADGPLLLWLIIYRIRCC